jgi:hypothetical protein
MRVRQNGLALVSWLANLPGLEWLVYFLVAAGILPAVDPAIPPGGSLPCDAGLPENRSTVPGGKMPPYGPARQRPGRAGHSKNVPADFQRLLLLVAQGGQEVSTEGVARCKPGPEEAV